MIRSKRFFAKKLKRVLLSANRAISRSTYQNTASECELCGGSGLANKGLMDVCNFCNGAGILSPTTHGARSQIVVRHSVEQIIIIEDFEELSTAINHRYSRIAVQYRNW